MRFEAEGNYWENVSFMFPHFVMSDEWNLISQKIQNSGILCANIPRSTTFHCLVSCTTNFRCKIKLYCQPMKDTKFQLHYYLQFNCI